MTIDSKKYTVYLKYLEIGIIAALIFFLCITYGGINYETNDDTAMNLIAAGAYGEPSQYLVYSGILWGYFIKLLYSIFPSVNCYLLTFLFLNLVSVISICVVLSEKLDLAWTAVVTVLVNVFCFKDFYVDIQYSKNAEIYAIVGTVLVISAIGKLNRYWGRLLAGAIFLDLGTAVRKEGAIQVAPLALVTLIFVFGQQFFIVKDEEIIEDTKNLSVTFVRDSLRKLVVPVVACLIVLATNFVAYDLNQDWKDYYQWDKIMVQKRDFGNYNFEWFQDEYLANGFTEWDFRLMENWMWNDCDNYSLDKIKLMAEIGKGIKMNRFRFDTKLVGDTAGLIGEAAKLSMLPVMFLVTLITSVFIGIRRQNWGGVQQELC
nr:hypothetical protein [uncultured Butyrivibrio sp.]